MPASNAKYVAVDASHPLPSVLDRVIVKHPKPSTARNAFSWSFSQFFLYGSSHTRYEYPLVSFSGNPVDVAISESRYGWPMNAFLHSDAIDMKSFWLANPMFAEPTPEFLSIDAIFGSRRDVWVRFDWRRLNLQLVPSSKVYPLWNARICKNCGRSHLNPELPNYTQSSLARTRSPWPVLEYIPAPVPLWDGVIINTLFWGGVLYAVSLLPRLAHKIKSRSRTRRGLCVICKYCVAGLKSCPECGTARA